MLTRLGLILVVASAAWSSAHAEVLTFINGVGGTVDIRAQLYNAIVSGSVALPGSSLNVAAGPGQAPYTGRNGLYEYIDDSGASNLTNPIYLGATPFAGLSNTFGPGMLGIALGAVVTNSNARNLSGFINNTYFTHQLPRFLSPGDVVGATNTFAERVVIGSAYRFGAGEFYGFVRNYQVPGQTFYELPATMTIGLNIQQADGVHYGYATLTRSANLNMPGGYHLVSWGYETTANTPITVIPAPGAMGVMGVALVFGTRRRRC